MRVSAEGGHTARVGLSALAVVGVVEHAQRAGTAAASPGPAVPVLGRTARRGGVSEGGRVGHALAVEAAEGIAATAGEAVAGHAAVAGELADGQQGGRRGRGKH